VSEKIETVRVAQELITNEEIPDSPRDDLEHLFWLEQGRKVLTDSVSLTSVRAAATSLMTGLGAMQTIYIGVLGFADFIPKEMKLPLKWFFAMPPILWLIALYLCLKVQKTEGMELRLKAPNEIRNRLQQLVRDKQHDLDVAFWLLFAGLAAAVLLLVWRRVI
jgi:hypothetical protein